MPDNTDALVAALAANAPDKGTPAPSTEGVTEATTTETTSQEQQPIGQSTDDGKSSAKTETVTDDKDVVIPTSVRDYLAQHPDQKAVIDLITGEIKSGLTPKLQEAAALRKQLEGVDPQAIETIRQLQVLAQEDPARVAEYFRQQAAQFDTMVKEKTPQDALADIVPVTDTEALLQTEIQNLKQWKTQQEKITQETVLNQEAQRIHRVIDAVEKKYGVEIPDDQRAEAWRLSRATGMSVDKVWLANNHEMLIAHLVKKAKDEGQTVVRSKQETAAAAPSSVAARQAETVSEKASNFKDFLRQTRAELADNVKAF